ncbi:hypothetical protein BOX15_Mlig000123g4 [Macrostomum lignano]|uniref:Uncharacterized protein n=2 Tax=Macrostomum lignano TaxID=282301 RepID=A0A267G9B6_9PLAT|nr:hypothetical protein BOX15_Mlig000123g3 [Macrostomum lignano]PAA82566.1 hypothetical protein BOX15_Mlig000123g4 [Macrostomum lignano]
MPRRCQGCCGMCKPRWVRLVDNIYPKNYLNKQPNGPKLNSLTHYSCRNPEKLARIAEYLESRLQRDLYRRKTGHVFVSMDIIDNLIKSCQRLDNFICTYLAMVTSLLENKDPELQMTGTQSFEKFSEIDKETPNYLKEYATLLECFVKMCHDASPDEAVRCRVRCAGLQGIMSMMRKVASDDLQINIWEQVHMNQILWGILFNLEEGLQASEEAAAAAAPTAAAPSVGGDVALLAEAGDGGGCASGSGPRPFDKAKEALEDLVMRANYNNMNCIVDPVLTHLDHNPDLWAPNRFAVFVFHTIICRIPKPSQAYAVVDRVIQHLNTVKSTPVKKAVVQVVSSIVGYAASDAIGPAVYNVFKELCRQLMQSIWSRDESSDVESQYREEVINTMVRYSEASPDTQKVEIMKYILSFEAQHVRMLDQSSQSQPEVEERKRKMLLKSLLKTVSMVAENYRTTVISNAFPFDFLPPLLKISMNSDPGIRVVVQNILQHLIDRHSYREAFSRVRLLPLPDSSTGAPSPRHDKPSRQDMQFMRSAMGSELLTHLYTQLQEESNRVDNFEKLYTTLCLLALETAADEALVEFFRLGLQTQDFLVSDRCGLKIVHKSAAMAVVAALFTLLCGLQPCKGIDAHVAEVIEQRNSKAPHFLPKVAFNRNNTAKSYATESITPELLFSTDQIESELKAAGFDTSTLRQPYESLMDLRAKLGDEINASNRGGFVGFGRQQPKRRESTFHHCKISATSCKLSGAPGAIVGKAPGLWRLRLATRASGAGRVGSAGPTAYRIWICLSARLGRLCTSRQLSA